MIIKSLELTNFRQFMGTQSLVFSTSTDKNVTIVIADNGTGKTTLEQSFSWIFFGETGFKKKEIYNSLLVKQLKEMNYIEAKGQLVVEHLGIEYVITRTNRAKKTANQKLSTSESELNIDYKLNGLSKNVKGEEAKLMIDEIMPQHLFPYFFFDGEKIEKIGNEIDRGKSKEFADAVRGMLGFNALYNAKGHVSKLISQYQNEYNKNSVDEMFLRLKKQKSEKSVLNEKREERKIEIESELEQYEDLRTKISDEIKQSLDVADKQERSKRLEGYIEKSEAQIRRARKDIFAYISQNMIYFLGYRLMNKAVSILNDASMNEKGIPGINSQAIDFILKEEKCICGLDLKTNTHAKITLMELMKYLPPQNLGSDINSFNVLRIENMRRGVMFWTEYKNKRVDLGDKIQQLDQYQKEYLMLVEQIKTYPNMAEKKAKEQKYYQKIKELNYELGELNTSIETTKREIENLNNEMGKHEAQDERNRKISLYDEYANEVLHKMEVFASKRENEKREQLKNEINTIFSQIFNSNMKIEIDEDYNITVINLEVLESLEKSSAQNVSITLSFIAGIIKMARDVLGIKNDDIIEDDLTTEPYPLVMDAPLSSFDKTRIKNVCDMLPNIAEQVVIFIKDTDGDIAKGYMKEFIGKEWKLSQLTNTSTIIEEVK